MWRATLTDGRAVVVKVGPPADARLLRYERGLIAAEAEYFRTVRAGAPAVPVPEVLHVGKGLDRHDAARVRLALYRVHLHVLMLAEGPSRGIPVGSERHDRLTDLLTEELRTL